MERIGLLLTWDRVYGLLTNDDFNCLDSDPADQGRWGINLEQAYLMNVSEAK